MNNQTDKPLKEIFEQAFFSGFYGYHLFEQHFTQEYYLFQCNETETGDAAWLVLRKSIEHRHEARLFDDEIKRGHRVIPNTLNFEHHVSFDSDHIRSRPEEVKRKVSEGGKHLAHQIDKCFMDVLHIVISNSPIEKQSNQLEVFLAEVADKLVSRDYNADRLLFPKKLKNRLALEVIDQDNAIQSDHYVGTTKTGLKAFWSSELPDNIALVFDSSAGLILTYNPRFWNGPCMNNPFCIQVGGELDVNLIIKDIQAIVPISISESRINKMNGLSATAKSIAQFLFKCKQPPFTASVDQIREATGCEEDDCQDAIMELLDEELIVNHMKSANTTRISIVKLTSEGRKAVRDNFVRPSEGVTIVEKMINIGDNNQISAPVVIADSIENSFNTLMKSDVDDNVKQLLRQLLEAVTEVNKQVPLDKADDAEAMVRDAEALVNEATSSKPRRRWYEVSVEGLKQAAVNIGEVADPVLNIVKKLLPLLLAAGAA